MHKDLKGTVISIAALTLVALAITVARNQFVLAQQAPAAPGPQMAEARFKNIQALKGIPADQVIPSMQFIANSLGVECEYCHVRGAFDKDDKEKKKTARKMIQMEFAINKDNFKGHTDVTCNTCHRGAAAPVAIPIIAELEPKPMPGGPNAAGTNPAANVPAGPTADQILDKYLQAAGGADAMQKITSRIERATLTGFGPGSFPIEIYAKAPDKRLSVMHTPRGENTTAFDGHVGWTAGFGPPREVTGGELENMKLDADLHFATDVKQLFTQFRVRPSEKVGDRDAYLVFGLKQGQPPVKLYFDEQSGLLVRQVQYVESALGRNPTQIDFADYRDADGVKVPFRWTIARPLGRFTIQVDQIQQNVAIDDAKFAKPPAPPPPPAGQKPPAP
jgi:hypothetical protein